MENSIWSRIIRFTRDSYTLRLKESLSGLGVGYFGFRPLFFDSIPPELLHTWIGVWAWIKTILSAYLASMATSLGAHHVELLKKKRNERPKKGKGRKAA